MHRTDPSGRQPHGVIFTRLFRPHGVEKGQGCRRPGGESLWYLLPSGRRPHGGHTYSVGGRPHVGVKRVRSRCLRRLGVPPRPPGTTFIRVSLARSAASLDGSSFVVLTPKWPSVSRGSYLLGWWQATCRGEEGEVKVPPAAGGTPQTPRNGMHPSLTGPIGRQSGWVLFV